MHLFDSLDTPPNDLHVNNLSAQNLPPQNLLPHDGTVNYYTAIMPVAVADSYFDLLLHTIPWQHDAAIIYGKKIITKRKVAWFGDAPFAYTYSKTTKTARPWTKELRELKDMVAQKCGETFNACLLNLYHDGNEGMTWHSDAEKELKKHAAIGSLSLGARRKFSLKHKTTKVTVSQMLDHGSLLVMKDETQTHWRHALPKTRTVITPRINLTFRTMAQSPP